MSLSAIRAKLEQFVLYKGQPIHVEDFINDILKVEDLQKEIAAKPSADHLEKLEQQQLELCNAMRTSVAEIHKLQSLIDKLEYGITAEELHDLSTFSDQKGNQLSVDERLAQVQTNLTKERDALLTKLGSKIDPSISSDNVLMLGIEESPIMTSLFELCVELTLIQPNNDKDKETKEIISPISLCGIEPTDKTIALTTGYIYTHEDIAGSVKATKCFKDPSQGINFPRFDIQRIIAANIDPTLKDFLPSEEKRAFSFEKVRKNTNNKSSRPPVTYTTLPNPQPSAIQHPRTRRARVNAAAALMDQMLEAEQLELALAESRAYAESAAMAAQPTPAAPVPTPAIQTAPVSTRVVPPTKKLAIDKPEADKPKADKPKADKPEADKPKADKPEADKPKADKPKADKPVADEPKADKPAAKQAKLTAAKPSFYQRLQQWQSSFVKKHPIISNIVSYAFFMLCLISVLATLNYLGAGVMFMNTSFALKHPNIAMIFLTGAVVGTSSLLNKGFKMLASKVNNLLGTYFNRPAATPPSSEYRRGSTAQLEKGVPGMASTPAPDNATSTVADTVDMDKLMESPSGRLFAGHITPDKAKQMVETVRQYDALSQSSSPKSKGK